MLQIAPRACARPLRTPHRALGQFFSPTATGAFRSAIQKRLARNRARTRGSGARGSQRGAQKPLGRLFSPKRLWGVARSYAFSTWIGAPRPRIPRVLPRESITEPARDPEGPQGGHERHPPPQPETGPRKHRENRGSPEFPHRIPRYLSGRRKPGRKGDGKYRYFGTTGCCIRVRIRGFPISGGQIGPKSLYCPA